LNQIEQIDNEELGAQGLAGAERFERVLQQLSEEQNFAMAIIAGGCAALVGAGIWAAVTVITGYQIGWLAIGVGFLVAYAVRMAGKGLTTKFKVLGALLALAGCAVGNFLTVCHYLGQQYGLGYFEVLTRLKPGAIPDLMASSFSGMDLVFYAIAAYEGYKLSLRQLPEAELNALQYAAVEEG